MTLPKAIASGPSADTPDAVKPVRVGILAGLITAAYLFVLYVAQPVPTRVLGLFGGAKNDVERHGGLEMIWFPPPGMNESEIFARFHVADDRAQVHRGTDAYVIRVPGIGPDQVEQTAARLSGEQGLEFHRVLRVDEMKELIRLLQLPMKNQEPVDADVDQWRPDEGGGVRTDYYLIAKTPDSLVTALREAYDKGWHLPPHARFAYERIEGEKGTWWRTYVIDERAEIDGGDIENAVGSYDPNTNRPIILLDFTREGGRKFGQLTSEIVGEKLATMIGDTIYSAPIINGAIRGGRASITMGGGDPRKQEADRDSLVATLRMGALPKGGKVMTSRYVAPVSDNAQQWLARGAIALGGGALIALLVWMVVRITRPVRRRALARPDAPAPWGRLFVTLLAPLAIYGVSKIVVIGISSDDLLYEFGGAGFHGAYERIAQQLSFGALGIMPVISAYVFVEVLALLVPSWRRRRHAGPDARAPINTAVVITAATLLFVQGWFVTTYIYALGYGNFGNSELLEYGMLPRMLVIGSFAIGTLVLVGVAALIREHGLGNGFGVLLLSSWLVAVVGRWLDLPGLIDPDYVIGGMTILVAGIAIIAVLRWRIARLGEAPLRVPTSGAVPLGEAGGLIALFGLISTFASEGMNAKIYEWEVTLREHRWLLIGVLAGMTLLWSFAFARPAVTRKLAERVGLVPAAQNAWWHATLLSLALLLLVGAITTTLAFVRPTALWLADAMTIAMLAAVVLDLYTDWRGRRVTLERVWSLHQAQHADLVVRALDDIGIPCHVSSANLRTVLAFFGPFAPIDVYVAPEHMPAARTRIRELIEN